MTVYLDTASTTFPSQECINDFIKCANEYYNPSSTYCEGGIMAHNKINKARHKIAQCINCYDYEIFFTSSGSEANSWAIMGMIKANNIHSIITTDIEHSSIYNACKYAEEKMNVGVYYLPIDSNGVVKINEYRDLLENISRFGGNTLVAVMAVNNELGTYNYIQTLSYIAKEYENTYFFTDAVQMFGKMPIDMTNMYPNVDLLSASGHKIGCFSGIGFLFIRDGIHIDPIIFGGKQEDGLRGGTENYCYIIPFANQVERVYSGLLDKSKKLVDLKEIIGDYITEEIPDATILSWGGRYIGIMSVHIEDVSASDLITMMEERGFIISAGSACSSGDNKPSRVLKNVGCTDRQALSTIRVSFEYTLSEDVAMLFCENLKECVEILRSLKPKNEKRQE